ncbi:MAG TPA: glycine cleavage T C-terminal barrel domain-containing protein [Pyrinomonadaceae bacterium]|nr:glycine cleavage T C-terminal barrel domain-containing protein [Pyrinomonadaceae bacterium]
MPEAVQSQTTEATPRRSPLEAVHLRAGALLHEQDGCVVAAHYGDAGAEYESVRGGGAGLFDLYSRGRIEVSGGEAVQFLNGMLTNDVAKLEDGAWMHAAFPNPQGRLLAPVRVLRRGGAFIFDTEAVTYGPVLKHLERYTLAGDFRVRDLTGEMTTLSIQGAGARQIVGTILGQEAAEAARGRVVLTGVRVSSARAQSGEVMVVRATHTAEDGFDLFVGASGVKALWEVLVTAGARPAGFDALEVLRVEAGLPRYGVDSSEANVVLEVVDEDASVSYTKGCYTGQEIIARIHWRGHVAKRLAGIIFARDAEPPSDPAVRTCDEGREVGRITSHAFSPRLRRRVALAVIRYDSLAPGTELKVFSGGEELCEAHVAELPLVRGSWYASGPAESEG